MLKETRQINFNESHCLPIQLTDILKENSNKDIILTK